MNSQIPPKEPDSTGDGEADVADEQPLSQAFGQSLAAAARRSGVSAFADERTPTSQAMLAALGGVRGLVETILPGLVFLVCYTIGHNLPISLGASVAVAVIFTAARVITRTPVTQALAGLIGVGVSAVLALITGKGQDNFIPGMVINAVFAIGLVGSMIARWPLIGLVAGFVMDEGTRWRSQRKRHRAMQALTGLWVLMFAVRLVVEVPLYLAGNVEALAVARLLTGIPLYAPLLLVSWFIVKAVFGRKDRASMVELSRRQDK